MKPDREHHLQDIKEELVERLDKKYREGQAEHGKKVENRDCLEEAMKRKLRQPSEKVLNFDFPFRG